ncbi:MAG: hypothetical protein WKF55_04150 [Gemmatimonadaceae bacterium]
MKPEIAAYLRYPRCEGELSCERTDIGNGRLKSGALECRSGHSFPIADYLPTFSPALGYVGAFEFLWSTPSCDLTVAHGDTFVRELTEREFSQQTRRAASRVNWCWTRGAEGRASRSISPGSARK